jgi:hypothetical protein
MTGKKLSPEKDRLRDRSDIGQVELPIENPGLSIVRSKAEPLATEPECRGFAQIRNFRFLDPWFRRARPETRATPH